MKSILTSFILFLFLVPFKGFSQLTPSICIVTADGVDAEDYRVYWNISADIGAGQIDSIYIFRRELGSLNFSLIDVVNNGLSNSYLDDDVATDVVNQYAIAYKFVNGTVGPLSKFHQPGVLSYDANFQGGGGENGGFAISQYVVEDLNQTGNYWDFLDTLKGIRVDNSGTEVVDLYDVNVWENAFLQTEFVIDLFNEAPNSPFQGIFVFDSIIGQCESFFKDNINTSRTNIKKKPIFISSDTTYTPNLCLVSSSVTNSGNYVVYWDTVPSTGGQPYNTVDSVIIQRKLISESGFSRVGSVEATGENFFVDLSSQDDVLTKYRIAYKFHDGSMGEPSRFHQASVIEFYESLPSTPGVDGMVFSNYLVEGTNNISPFISSYDCFYQEPIMTSYTLLGNWPGSWAANEFSTNSIVNLSDVYMDIVFDSVIGQCQGTYYRDNINTSRTNIKRKIIEIQDTTSSSSIDEINFDISLTPNPVENYLTIKMKDNSDLESISVLDLSGKLLLRKQIKSSIEVLDLAQLKNGIYFVRLEDVTGLFYERKIIKR